MQGRCRTSNEGNRDPSRSNTSNALIAGAKRHVITGLPPGSHERRPAGSRSVLKGGRPVIQQFFETFFFQFSD